MVARSNIFTSPGGDTVQIVMTAEYLEKIGVSVDIKPVQDITSTDSYDLLHFFNIIRPDDILPFLNSSKPYCVSTIFVDYTEYEKRNRKGIGGLVFRLLNSGQIEYLKAIARWLINGDPIKSKYYLLRGHKPSIRKIAFGASVLLPNSDNEAERFFSFMKTRFAYRKVVNAINSNIFNESVVANALYENHILCVGRIEGRKNQLNLIKAVLQTPYHLTIIGKPSPNHISYYQECKFLASKSNKIQFIEHIEHEELVSIYRAAKVHVLPSWFETTGLSTLEAAVMECNIVITKKGDTEEYFRDYAYYCDPKDVMSIKSAIEIAYKSPINPELKNFILQNYTWEKTAEQTKNAYIEMINSKR